ncbi:CDP-alcohol phosphatidyltransferase family protein [Marinobacteraceae bacterium S3BR75-40.1]
MTQRFLIRLTRVDLITLTGLTLTGLALWLMAAGWHTFALAVLYLAMLADALDGYCARRWGLVREFGRYLDGFVDTFLYLVAPAFWLWQWGFDGPLAALLILGVWISGIVRLAVFNMAGNNTLDGRLVYQGMPVFWLLFILGGARLLGWLVGEDIARSAIYGAWPVAALLMVWNRPFFKFTRLAHILTLVLGGAAIFFFGGLMEYYG